MTKGRIVAFTDLCDLTPEERARVKRVNCGPECEYCDDTYKRGISIGKLDYMGDPYPDATTVVLDKRSNEWVVYVYDADAQLGQREAKRYPASEVEVIRNLPCETRLYGHTVLMPEDPFFAGPVVPLVPVPAPLTPSKADK